MRRIRKGVFKLLAAACCLLLCLCLFSGRAESDFGGFSGNSDYGGGGGGREDSGGGFGGGWSGGGSYNGGDGLGVASFFGAASLASSEGDDWVLGAIVLVIFFFVWSSMRKTKQRALERHAMPQGGASVGSYGPSGAGLNPMSDYVRLDANFDEASLKTALSNLYVQMQDAWRDKDIEPLRPYLTDAFYMQVERQLDGLRKARQTDYTERIAVLGVELLGWKQGGGVDTITARLRTRIVSYVLDERGNVVSGDRNREKFMEYEWDLVRKSGTKTAESGGLQTASCPNCGAPLTIGATGRCPYCGSVISTLSTNWAVSAIRGISQQTV